MKALKLFLLLCVGAIAAYGTQDRIFSSSDFRMKVYQGDRVLIQADSAYIVSTAQTLLLNEKLKALQQAQLANQHLLENHHALLEKVQKIEWMTAQLLQRLQKDHRMLNSNLVQLLAELDQSIAYLQHTNEELAINNAELTQQLTHMDETVKHLRTANRKLAWQQARKKIGIALGAFGLGFLLGSN